jgi:hypothetical protein
VHLIPCHSWFVKSIERQGSSSSQVNRLLRHLRARSLTRLNTSSEDRGGSI